MFCPKCGEILRDNALCCPVCGADLKKAGPQINDACDCPTNKRVHFEADRTHSTYPPAPPTGPRGDPSVGEFAALLKTFFRRCFDFQGRSSRWEFWWTYLFLFLVTVLLADMLRLLALWFLVMIVPFTALGVRRLHDTGRSGWWLLVKAVPVVGVILLIIWFCQPSAAPNRWSQK